jgi:isoquinoline 1-oxidoreductase beta subunit
MTNVDIVNLSRRGFLKGVFSTGALVLGVRLLPGSAWAADQLPLAGATVDSTVFHPGLFLGINPDGTVIIVAHRSEMGTGIRTSLPRVVADELDADWSRVRIQQAIGDPRYGEQNTDGSRSVRYFFDTMREAGATGRMMLIAAAAKRWKVSPEQCTTTLHAVVHSATGRKLGYGQLASAAAKMPVPNKDALKFKSSSQWRYIGKKFVSYDLAGICTGKPLYGGDVKVDGMVYASVEHPPVLGGKVKSHEDRDALKVRGVHKTVLIPPFKPPYAFQALGGVAVIANSTWAAFEGRKKLKVAWDDGPNASYNSPAYRKELEETARRPGRVVRSEGDVEAVFSKGGRIIEAGYYAPHLAHAATEPPVAVAHYHNGKVTAWAPVQNPQAVQEAVAGELGIKKEDVICHVTMLGCAFGRKSKPDFVVEAALLSKALGRPVKVAWTREDDIKFDYYHAVAAMYLKAAVGQDGMPAAWLQRSVFPSLMATFNPNQDYGSSLELSMGWNDIPFAVPNLQIENGRAIAHVRIGWLRSVANVYHAFAVQSFVDELAHAAGRDPVDYQLALNGPARILNLGIKDYWNYGSPYSKYPIETGRLNRVLEMCANQAGWGKRKSGNGWGMGIAVHRSFTAYVATAVQVEVDHKGKVTIARADTVVDAGLVVSPEMVVQQFEGAAGFAAGIARTGEITATNGRIDQSNFNDYEVARFADAPYETRVTIVPSDAPPCGVGEPGVPPFIPAFYNAIFAATGKRLRELPLSKHNLAA